MAKGKVTYISKTIPDIDLLLSLEKSNFGHPSLGIATIISILQTYRKSISSGWCNFAQPSKNRKGVPNSVQPGKGSHFRQRCNNDPFSDSPCLKLPSTKQILRALSKSKSKRDIGLVSSPFFTWPEMDLEVSTFISELRSDTLGGLRLRHSRWV